MKNIQIQGPSHVYYYLFLQTFQLSRFCQVSPSLWYPVPVFRIESICTGFYISHQKKFSYFQNPTFIANYIYSNSYLECYKNITVLSSTKMLFWKHSIRTFECYFERHTFDFITSSGKLVQKLSSEQSFLKTLKQKVNSLDSWSIISEFINGNKNEKIVFLLQILRKKQI